MLWYVTASNRKALEEDLSHDVREFEAESVSYLVCNRLGIDTASDEAGRQGLV
jgi:hypothetical protein